MKLCTLVDSYHRFGGTYCFSLQDIRVSSECKIKYRYALENGPLEGQCFLHVFYSYWSAQSLGPGFLSTYMHTIF